MAKFTGEMLIHTLFELIYYIVYSWPPLTSWKSLFFRSLEHQTSLVILLPYKFSFSVTFGINILYMLSYNHMALRAMIL